MRSLIDDFGWAAIFFFFFFCQTQQTLISHATRELSRGFVMREKERVKRDLHVLNGEENETNCDK